MMEAALTSLSYTPDFIRENVVPLGDGGNLAVPISPSDGFRLIQANLAQRDPKTERESLDAVHKGIDDRFKALQEDYSEWKKSRGMDPELGPEEINRLSVQASDAYIAQMQQARHAYKVIVDEGVESPHYQTVAGATHDPFRMTMRPHYNVADTPDLAGRGITQDLLPGLQAKEKSTTTPLNSGRLYARAIAPHRHRPQSARSSGRSTHRKSSCTD